MSLWADNNEMGCVTDTTNCLISLQSKQATSKIYHTTRSSAKHCTTTQPGFLKPHRTLASEMGRAMLQVHGAVSGTVWGTCQRGGALGCLGKRAGQQYSCREPCRLGAQHDAPEEARGLPGNRPGVSNLPIVIGVGLGLPSNYRTMHSVDVCETCRTATATV